MNPRLVIPGLLALVLVAPSAAQSSRAVGGPGPTGSGFFTQDLPSGFRIQGINPPSWRVPGNSGMGPLPKGQILRTPQSQRLADRLAARKQAQISRSQLRRSDLINARPSTRSGASWDYLRSRRSRLERAKLTQGGRVEPDPVQGRRPPSPGMRSARPAEESGLPPTESETTRADHLSNWKAEREERRKLQEAALRRVMSRKRDRENQRAAAERHASRRYGLSGGTRPSR